MNNKNITGKIIWLVIFGIAMAYVESAVVVYLRAIFHPEGFKFPLKAFNDYKIIVEVFREVATILMLLAVAALAGKRLRERLAYFMLSFGVWDIFYYVWLKVLLDWPSSLFDWDILFLIPTPWIGPVMAPVSIAILMIIFSILMSRESHNGSYIRPTLLACFLALSGTAVVLYSFMCDTGATLHGQMPKPYRYELLIAGDVLFVAAFGISYFKRSNTIFWTDI